MVGSSLSLSLEAGGGMVDKVGSKILGQHVSIQGITAGLVNWVCSA